MNILARLSRTTFLKALGISVLAGIAVIPLSMLPMIGDRTGYAGFYVLFGMMFAPVIVVLGFIVASFGRLMDIGLPPAIAVIIAASIYPGYIPFDSLGFLVMVPWMIAICILGQDVMRRPRLASNKPPVMVFTVSSIILLAYQIAIWINFSPMSFIVGPIAGMATIGSTLWIMGGQRSAERTWKPSERSEGDPVTRSLEDTFRGTPWLWIGGISLLSAIGMHAPEGSTDFSPVLQSPRTAILIGLVLAPLHQYFRHRKPVALAFAAMAMLPFVHWGLMKAGDLQGDVPKIWVATSSPGISNVEVLLSQTRYDNGNTIPDFMNLLEVHLLVIGDGAGGYQMYDNKDGYRNSPPPVVTLDEAIGNRSAIVFDRTGLGNGRFNVKISFREAGGDEQLLAERTWSQRQKPLAAFPIVGPYGWGRVESFQNVNHEREAMNDAISLIK